MPQPKYLAMYALVFVLVIAVVSGIPGLTKSYLSQQPSETRLLVGANVWPGYEPLFLAQDLGILPIEKVRLVEYSTATQVARALSNNVVQAAALTLDEALRVMALGIDIEVVLVLDISAGGDMLLSRPGLADMASLQGRKVGVESTALGAFVIARALAINDMSSADIEIVSLEIDEHAQAITDGEIDAVVTFNPVAGRLKAAGLIELFSSKEIPGEIVDVLVVRSDQLEQHLKGLQTLGDAWFQALDYIEASPEDAHRRMAPRLESDVSAVARELEMLRFPSKSENLIYLGQQNELGSVIEKILPVLRQLESLPSNDAFLQMANPVLLEYAAP